MKCKSWSHKINNFIARRLKSIKINSTHHHQQQLSTLPSASEQEPPPTSKTQQYLSTCNTMPAMPKEKATAVSLSESNFTELKLKELATSAAVVAATAATAVAMASTATASASTMAATSRLHTNDSAMTQQRSSCSCGVPSTDCNVVDHHIMYQQNARFLPNGHKSPLAPVIASQNSGLTESSSAVSPMRNNCSCHEFQNGNDNNAQQMLRDPNDSAAGVIIYGGNIVSSTMYTSGSCLTSTSSCVTTPPKKSPKDFIFGKYIGEGSFSIVYLAVDVSTKREYAIKVCEKRQILREHKQEYVRREREVMHLMTNVSGFVNLSCTFQDNRSLYFVMTYAKNGDLLPYINKVGSFDVEVTRHYAAELVLACEQMHRRNVVHRDLKPENILFDENMHTLIADFGSAKILTPEEAASKNFSTITTCATNLTLFGRQSRVPTRNHMEENNDDVNNDTNTEDVDSPYRQPRYHRKRKGSFVGTAQYVSPEILQNSTATPAVDIWALGCIIYQMISGLPPFRGSNDYVIFKEILACNLEFPQGFDKDAENLVRQLLKVNPEERLGAQDINGYYESIRSHPFFADINFDSVRQQTPPPIYPYLPGACKEEDFRSQYRVPENLEPGLDDKQLTRLLGMELGTAQNYEHENGVVIEQKTVMKNIFDISDIEKQKRLDLQKSDKWHIFADNEVILKKGYVNKRKGLFARKRMLLLTTGPRLIYIDPIQMVKKGEIPWSLALRVEAKNFKIFFVHTPNRTYYLEDPEGYSLEWVDAIEKMRVLTYNDLIPLEADIANATSNSTTELKTAST